MIKTKIWVITHFPELFIPYSKLGVIGRALSGEHYKFVDLEVLSLKDYSPKGVKGIDDTPYGGGQGMVLRADVLKNALLEGVVKKGGYDENWREKLNVIYTSPRGRVWNRETCRSFSRSIYGKKDVVFICGRYEGIDERFIKNYVQEIYSLGDFVLSGGDIAVMAMIDSSLRLVKGVLGNDLSFLDESFEDGLLEYPCYTRPSEFEGNPVPEILLSGHHKNIEDYRMKEKVRLTKKHREDLYFSYKKRKNNE